MGEEDELEQKDSVGAAVAEKIDQVSIRLTVQADEKARIHH